MRLRLLLPALAVVVGLTAGGGVAAAKKKRVEERKVCTRVKGKRRCRWVPRFDGHGVARSALRSEPVPRPSGAVAFEPNHRPGVIIRGQIYTAAGDFDDAALAELDRGFACKRTGDLRAVDPHLYEIMSSIYDHFGGKTIVLVSGHRFQKNESSRHFHASAMDIYIPGVSIRELYDFASSLDTGGMGVGLYPNSGFVHVDRRAPGAPSYRWTDWSGPRRGKSHKKPPGKKRPPKHNT